MCRRVPYLTSPANILVAADCDGFVVCNFCAISAQHLMYNMYLFIPSSKHHLVILSRGVDKLKMAPAFGTSTSNDLLSATFDCIFCVLVPRGNGSRKIRSKKCFFNKGRSQSRYNIKNQKLKIMFDFEKKKTGCACGLEDTSHPKLKGC